MKTKLFSILILSALALLISGCATTQKEYGGSSGTLGGLVTVEKNTYSKTGPLTIGVKTSELVPRKNTNGGRVRFLYGMFTIADD